jgi:hypothetical protein
MSCLVLGASAALAQETRPKDVPDGPVPSVQATEAAATGPVVFRVSPDLPAAVPNHPPIGLIPPKPMPEMVRSAPASSGPGGAVIHDSRTGKTWTFPSTAAAGADGGVVLGGGYSGPDGPDPAPGDVVRPATLSGSMTLISTALRAMDPWRMNAKLVLRIGSSYFVCSGTMRDARTVLTAGHCVNDGGGGPWADEIWVYPGWDGAGSILPPSSIINPYGWAYSTTFGSWTGWTVDGDFNYDVGIVALDRGVGFLTGWFGWAYGGSCPGFWTTTTVNNASYPAQACGEPGLHNGLDMYYWYGTFDSCPDTNRLGLTTTPGCFNAIWGGMSGSGAYYIDSGSRYVHGICSTSNRSTYAEYQRQFQAWVDWNNTGFIPTYGRGSTFDLEALDMNAGATVVPAGSSVSLDHLAVNGTDGTANGTWTFRVYLSTNDNVETTDTLLATQYYDWDFGGLGSVRVNMGGITIPSNTPPGNYYLGVIYDSSTDGNPANNDTDGWDAVAITVTKPDLDVTVFTAPSSVQPGESITVPNTVQNIGNASSGDFRVGIYFSSDSTCNTSDTLLASRAVGSLGPGGSSAANTMVTVPVGAGLGTRYLCAIADDLGQVAETSESNNSETVSISVVQPDLTVSALSAPAKTSPGASITATATVTNGGTAGAGASRLGFYLSGDATCTTGDTFLGSRAVPALAAGASSAGGTGLIIPAATPLGSYFLCAIADDLGAVAESSEANNTRSSALSVVSATPVITLKVNGQHPTPPVVTVSGPTQVTLDVSPTTYTASVDWYWAIIYNRQIFWVTSGGLSTIPAPWFNAPPVTVTNFTLLNVNLPAGSTLTNVMFMLNGTTAVAFDFITATRP